MKESFLHWLGEKNNLKLKIWQRERELIKSPYLIQPFFITPNNHPTISYHALEKFMEYMGDMVAILSNNLTTSPNETFVDSLNNLNGYGRRFAYSLNLITNKDQNPKTWGVHNLVHLIMGNHCFPPKPTCVGFFFFQVIR